MLPKARLGLTNPKRFPAPKDKNDRQSAGSGSGAFFDLLNIEY
jgi:hypothetical protein